MSWLTGLIVYNLLVCSWMTPEESNDWLEMKQTRWAHILKTITISILTLDNCKITTMMPMTKWAVPTSFCTQQVMTNETLFDNTILTKSPKVINPRISVLRNAMNIRAKEMHVKTSEEITRILCRRNHPPLGRAGFIWRAIPIPNQASIGHANIIRIPTRVKLKWCGATTQQTS